MNMLYRTLAISMLLAANAPAFGCSFAQPAPQEKYKDHATVVLAYPLSIANDPTNALSRDFQGTFTQTVQWQVLVSWKGRYRPGDVFFTQITYKTSNCGNGAQRERAATLLYLNGQEPYKDVLDERPDENIETMKYLAQLRHGG
jgi:hypothetical protein